MCPDQGQGRAGGSPASSLLPAEPSWPGKVLCPPCFPGTISGPPSKAADILPPLLFYKVNPRLFPCRAYTHPVVPPTIQSQAPHLRELVGPCVLLAPLA